MELKSVDEIVSSVLVDDGERRWAREMGFDHRRAWETAPSVEILCTLAAALSSADGNRAFLRSLLDVMGGDGEALEALTSALHGPSPIAARRAAETLHNLPRLGEPTGALAAALRAAVSYEALTRRN